MKPKKRNRYSSQIEGTTLEALVEADRKTGAPAVDLLSEIEIARAMCGEGVKLLAATTERMVQKDDGTWCDVSAKSWHYIVRNAQHSLSYVAKLVEKQAKIWAMGAGSHDGAMLRLMVARVTAALERRLLPSEKELFETCCADLAEIVQEAETEGNVRKKDIQVLIS